MRGALACILSKGAMGKMVECDPISCFKRGGHRQGGEGGESTALSGVQSNLHSITFGANEGERGGHPC
jgi:hypothetical protein